MAIPSRNSGTLGGERILVTGGAGFIGSRLARALQSLGAEVLAFDNLHPQVHGDHPAIDPSLPLVRGDVRDGAALGSTVHEFLPTIVVHLAAETGTGQSADEPTRYAQANVVGTAQLIEALRTASRSPSRVILAGTRAVYGEGAYRDRRDNLLVPPPRRDADMSAGRFGLFDEKGEQLVPVATPENTPPAPISVYGSTKLMQEYLLQQTQAPWDVAILRLQNVYGPGQSLRNPYTGVLSIFCQQAMQGQVLNLYEDGEIQRDFIFVDDVVSAFVAACTAKTAAGRIINIGSGQTTSIAHAAERILSALGLPASQMSVSGAFRLGDVRHAVADTRVARQELGWSPEIGFDKGISRLVEWARSEFIKAGSHGIA
jgi:dTDP-L-rhamnose 4-epimerase